MKDEFLLELLEAIELLDPDSRPEKGAEIMQQIGGNLHTFHEIIEDVNMLACDAIGYLIEDLLDLDPPATKLS